MVAILKGKAPHILCGVIQIRVEQKRYPDIEKYPINKL